MAINQIEKGRINRQELQNYLDELRNSGNRLPINQQGQVNKTKIATKCGFHRQVFKTNQTMKKLLEDAVNEIGTDISAPVNDENYLSKKISDSEMMLSQLRRGNSLMSEEITALRKQIMELESENNRLKHKQDETEVSFEEMLQTGRRFTL